MTTDIAAAVERLERILADHPDFGVHTAESVSTIGSGLRCVTNDGSWQIETDVPEPLGGDNSAPSPSVLVRAALGSCLAMGYRMRAARRGVAVEAISVTVTTEGAVAGMLLDGSGEPAGFRRIDIHVDVVSDAPTSDVSQVLDEGDRLSPLIDMLQRVNEVHRTVSVTAPTPVGGSV